MLKSSPGHPIRDCKLLPPHSQSAFPPWPFFILNHLLTYSLLVLCLLLIHCVLLYYNCQSTRFLKHLLAIIFQVTRKMPNAQATEWPINMYSMNTLNVDALNSNNPANLRTSEVFLFSLRIHIWKYVNFWINGYVKNTDRH